MIYDVIIVGAGASGLFSAASFKKKVTGLILNNAKAPGMKLLMSGAGQCNITNTGDIKGFMQHYGNNGPKIRKPLYKFSNQALIDYLESKRIPTFEREDGKIFPESLNSKEVLDLLLSESRANGFSLRNEQCVTSIVCTDADTDVNKDTETDTVYTLTTQTSEIYKCKNLILATGGLSYPVTGSDGSMLPIFAALGLGTIPCKPSLVPIFLEDYLFASLSCISFADAIVTIKDQPYKDGLLLTHRGFSGPAVLNISRYASPGIEMTVNYLPSIAPLNLLSDLKSLLPGNIKQISTVIHDYIQQLNGALPKRFIELICQSASINPTAKAATVSGKKLQSLVNKLTKDSYKISGTAGYQLAMCTSGGVSLDEIHLNTCESKKYPHLYIIGEALDVDGDTGGYNIQFAFSSGYICAKDLSSKLV